MIITHYREKLINTILYFAKNTKKCGITKLMKLLYFLDFTHFKQTGKSVTDLDYFAWNFGPVPVEVWEEMSNGMGDDLGGKVAVTPIKLENEVVFQLIKAKARKKFDSKHFTKREIKLLEQTAEIFKEADAEQMIMVSHLPNDPWDKTLKEKGEKAKIDYMLAIDDMDDSLSYEDALEKMQDRKHMHSKFGTMDS